MALQFRADLSPVVPPDDPKDAVEKRELHILDGNGQETVQALTPDTTTTTFIVMAAPGKTGQCALVDINRNGSSTASSPAAFPLDPPPPNTGPVPPTPEQPVVTLLGEVPDPPTQFKGDPAKKAPGWTPGKK